MKFSTPALVITSLVVPSATAYQNVYFGLGRPILRTMSPRSPMLQRQQSMIDRALNQQSMIERAFQQLDQGLDLVPPSDSKDSGTMGYEITNNDEIFSISLDVPGVDPANIDVSISDDVLTLSGSRQTKTSNYKFKNSFVLDPSVVVEGLNANLENGVLVVSAPKDVKKPEEKIMKIPITVGKVNLPTASIDESKDTEDVEETEESEEMAEETIDLDKTDEEKAEAPVDEEPIKDTTSTGEQ